MSHRTKKVRDSETLKNLELESFHILNRYNSETFLLSENIFLWATQFILFELRSVASEKGIFKYFHSFKTNFIHFMLYYYILYLYFIILYIIYIFVLHLYLYYIIS